MFVTSNGRPTRIIKVASGRSSAARRHPYRVAVLVVVATALLVFVVKATFHFPPFLAFACVVAACPIYLGVRPGLLALTLSALISDFFFIEPLWTLTRYSFILAAYYLAAAGALWFFTRKFCHTADGPKA